MRMASDYTPRLRIPVFRHSRLLAPRPAGFGAPSFISDFLQKLRCIGRLRLLARTNAEASQTSFVRLFVTCFVQMLPKKVGAQETLHARNSPPTHRIRDVTAPSRFATHPLQVMSRSRADPVCPSTPASIPERNHHVGRLLGPNACLMPVWGLAEPDSSAIRHAEGMLARVLARGRSLVAPSNASVRALPAMQLGSG